GQRLGAPVEEGDGDVMAAGRARRLAELIAEHGWRVHVSSRPRRPARRSPREPAPWRCPRTGRPRARRGAPTPARAGPAWWPAPRRAPRTPRGPPPHSP